MKYIIPSISGIISGFYLSDLTGISIYLAVLLGLIVFNGIWLSYARLLNQDLKKDALTFLPFIILLLYPLKNLLNLGDKFAEFGALPSLMLLIVAIPLFLFLKILFSRKVIKDIKQEWPIYIIILIYFLVFTTLSVLKHFSFLSTGFDLGIYDQAVWGYTKFMLTDSIMGFPILAGHIQWTLFLITPLYMIFSSPVLLLVVQSGLIAVGGWPLFMLSKKVIKNNYISYALVIAYYLYPSIQFPNLFDFHPLVLAVPFIFYAFYFFETKADIPFIVSLIIIGISKEHLPLVLVPFGLFYFFKRKKRIGIYLAIIGLVWFVVNIMIVIPAFSNSGYLFVEKGTYFGDTIPEVITTIITRPLYTAQYLFVVNKFAFALLLLAPVVFGIFAILGIEYLLIGITEIGILFLHLPNSLTEIVYHHQSTVAAFVMIASVYGIKRFLRFKRKNIKVGIAVLLVSTALLSNIVYGPFAILYDIGEFDVNSDYAKTGRKFISMIPEDASVAAPNWIVPHLSQRKEIYMLSHFLDRRKELFDSGEISLPQYIVMDVGEALYDAKRSALRISDEDLNNLFNDQRYGIILHENSWVLLRKGADYNVNICSFVKENPNVEVGQC